MSLVAITGTDSKLGKVLGPSPAPTLRNGVIKN